MSSFKSWYDAHKNSYLDDFCTFLRFKSISTDPAYKEETLRAADWLCAYLQKIGLQAKLWETSGYPVVFGEYFAGEECPTLFFYNHYDVQPVDPLELWTHDPFSPHVEDGTVYARGASDDKGQCMYTVAAMGAFLALAQQKKVNIKYFVEGEEESGSEGATEALKRYKERLRADALFVIDAGMPARNKPAVTIGVRGILGLEVTCRNTNIDLHSGMHGGIVLNPNRALAKVLAGLWDDEGRVQVPGFYDAVRSPSAEEMACLDLSFDRKEYAQEFGVRAFTPEAEREGVRQVNWLGPTLEINGMCGGYTGPGFKTVIPAVAQAKVSCRLVPDQDPEKVAQAIEAHLRAQLPKGLELSVQVEQGAPAYRVSPKSQAVQRASHALTEAFGIPAQCILCGASVPIVGDLAAASGAETVLVGVGLDTDDIHAPNEHFDMERFEKGFLTIANILEAYNVKIS